MAESNVLRYDAIPSDDFLQALTLHEQNAARGALPPPGALRAVKMAGEVGDSAWPIELYSCAEHNPLTGETESFVVLRGPAPQARELERFAVALKRELIAKGLKALFRIDPRYGLLMGSNLLATDPAVRAGNWAFVTLYLTEDPGHAALALLDYVAKDHRKRYEALWQKYNGAAPRGAPAFAFSFGKLLGKKPPAAPAAPVSPIRYPRLRTLLVAMNNLFYARKLAVSIIFAGITKPDQEKCLLDSGRSAYLASGTPGFFASLDELLA